jgi:hypothetical protein
MQPNSEVQIVTDTSVGQLMAPAGPASVIEDDVTLIPDPTAGPVAFWTNLDKTKEENIATIMRCLNAADTTAGKKLGEEVLVRALFVQPVCVVDRETGELRPCRRIVFVLADGSTLSTCSEGVFGSVRALIPMKGVGPWDQPLRVRFRQVETRAGRRIYVMDYIAGGKEVIDVIAAKENPRAKSK